MNIEISEIDCMMVEDEEGVGGTRGAKSGGAADLADAGAGLPRPEARLGVVAEEGYQIVTRAKGRPKQAAKSTTTRPKTGTSQPGQEAEVSKKRRAEDALARSSDGSSTANQIEEVKSLVLRLLDREESKAREDEEKMEEISDLRQEVRDLKKEVRELKKMIQASKNKTQAPTYAEVTRTSMPTAIAKGDTASGMKHQQKLRVEDDKCSITVNTSRVKDEKSDFVAVKSKFQQAINDRAAMGKAKITCLRQLPGERINVVFASAADATRARNRVEWLGAAMPNARVLSEPWYPVKCDMVAKRAVLDDTAPDGRTLRQEVCAEFARDNAMVGLDFTAMKASWLSRLDPRKANGSMVIWLKSKAAAEWLLQTGQALFGGGAYGAFCSKYLQETSSKVCYNCNAYGHTQANCRRVTRCGNCSGGHQTRDCAGTAALKCPACLGAHTIKDWCCKHHPAHKKYLAQLPKEPVTPHPTRSEQSAAPGDRDAEMDSPDPCK